MCNYEILLNQLQNIENYIIEYNTILDILETQENKDDKLIDKLNELQIKIFNDYLPLYINHCSAFDKNIRTLTMAIYGNYFKQHIKIDGRDFSMYLIHLLDTN
jgi:hypothetical protein